MLRSEETELEPVSDSLGEEGDLLRLDDMIHCLPENRTS